MAKSQRVRESFSIWLIFAKVQFVSYASNQTALRFYRHEESHCRFHKNYQEINTGHSVPKRRELCFSLSAGILVWIVPLEFKFLMKSFYLLFLLTQKCRGLKHPPIYSWNPTAFILFGKFQPITDTVLNGSKLEVGFKPHENWPAVKAPVPPVSKKARCKSIRQSGQRRPHRSQRSKQSWRIFQDDKKSPQQKIHSFFLRCFFFGVFCCGIVVGLLCLWCV